MAVRRWKWTLTEKIGVFVGVFLLLALMSVGATLWISWNLAGGAAAVNEAGRLRMMSYRLALTEASGRSPDVAREVAEMQKSLDLLRAGSQSRPLFVPWDASIRLRYADVLQTWKSTFRPRWLGVQAGGPPSRAEVDAFVGQINGFVTAIERRLDFWTTVLHGFQLAMAGLVVLGGLLMFYAAYLLVLEPVGKLTAGVHALAAGDYAARVAVETSDELGDLGRGFNQMAEQLQGVYAELEQRVVAKTAALQQEQQRLRALYEVSALVAQASSLEELAAEFTAAIRRIAGADAAALRWTDEAARRYLLLASEGLPKALVDEERCLMSGSCHCGRPQGATGVAVVQFHRAAPGAVFDPATDEACTREGFTTLLSVTVASQGRQLGEVDLFYRHAHHADAAEHALLEVLASHLAAAMEGLRNTALEREAAVAQERTLLARELHDSIAQSLAFMKIQTQLLRSAWKAGQAQRVEAALDELDVGVQESLADVRELLLHFRTRTQEQDIEPALRSTLHKFELQSGLQASLHYEGHGQPLDPDVQIQVLHVLQEALSNVRKHAHARRVDVEVQSLPTWRFSVRDDGRGLDMAIQAKDRAAHVGMQIMHERAAAIGAHLTIESAAGQGTTVTLELPAPDYPLRSALPTPAPHAA